MTNRTLKSVMRHHVKAPTAHSASDRSAPLVFLGRHGAVGVVRDVVNAVVSIGTVASGIVAVGTLKEGIVLHHGRLHRKVSTQEHVHVCIHTVVEQWAKSGSLGKVMGTDLGVGLSSGLVRLGLLLLGLLLLLMGWGWSEELLLGGKNA